jgi:hypothetical protein
LPLQDILGQKSEFQDFRSLRRRLFGAKKKSAGKIAGAFELMLFSEFATD